MQTWVKTLIGITEMNNPCAQRCPTYLKGNGLQVNTIHHIESAVLSENATCDDG